jgi:transposase
MKKVSKIDPEKEYELAKKIIELASVQALNKDDVTTLDTSVANIVTAVRVLMEREALRRGNPSLPKEKKPKGRQQGEAREESKKLPSLKYPDILIEVEVVLPLTVPICACCQSIMKESGLFEVSEKLEVIPKKYFVKRIKRAKFNCPSCYGSLTCAPAVPCIIPTSNYGDSLVMDVAISKYNDFIPVERYCQIAFQVGLGGDLPAQSLIGLTHHLANFLFVVYEKIKNEVCSSSTIHIDESPHKMLEGDDTKNWFLWGFFCTTSCYFETHNTRSGDVAYNFLKHSSAKTIMTDGLASYARAAELLKVHDGKIINEAHCNAHAYRYFEEAQVTWKSECEFFLKTYGDIYEIERQRVELNAPPNDPVHLECRQKMLPLFESIKSHSEELCKSVMPKSTLDKALNYFLNHYEGLTQCVHNINVPLDNNLAERELRSHVVGRKTWIGTHSKRGALTSSIMFSIMNSCKINNINPRQYLPWVVNTILKKQTPLTPHEYKILNPSPS